MPLIFLLRALFGLLSWLVLAAIIYLLWSWWDGEWVRDTSGALYRDRDDWRLWIAIGLAGWSLLGRVITTPLLARGDRGPPSRPERDGGDLMAGADGAELYVEILGDDSAPTVVLTHGWGLDSTIWGYAKRDLVPQFRLVAWDLPGLGRSKLRKRGKLTLDFLADNLAAVIEAIEPGPVVLVGHSIGGMTIQTLARDYPELFRERVAGVVLVNTTYTNPLRTMVLSRLLLALRRPIIEPMMYLAVWLQPIAWLSAWQGYLNGSAHLANRAGFGRFVTRSQLEHTTLLATRNPPGVQALGNLAMFRWDVSATLSTIPGPVLVIGGDADIVTKLDASRVISTTVPGASLRRWGGSITWASWSGTRSTTRRFRPLPGRRSTPPRYPSRRRPAAACRRRKSVTWATWHGQKSWNGVAILARDGAPNERTALPGDPNDLHRRYTKQRWRVW